MKNLGKPNPTKGLHTWGQNAGGKIGKPVPKSSPGHVTKRPGGGKK